MPRRLMHVIAVLALCLAVAAVATGHVGRPGKHKTQDELQAERLVQFQVGEDVDCHDSHVVNRKLVPEGPWYYICRRADGLNYQAIVTSGGLLASLSGPFRIQN